MEVRPAVRAVAVSLFPRMEPDLLMVRAKLTSGEVLSQELPMWDWTYFSPPVFISKASAPVPIVLHRSACMNRQGDGRIQSKIMRGPVDEIEQPRFVRPALQCRLLTANSPRERIRKKVPLQTSIANRSATARCTRYNYGARRLTKDGNGYATTE